jgi:hypothetical protein
MESVLASGFNACTLCPIQRLKGLQELLFGESSHNSRHQYKQHARPPLNIVRGRRHYHRFFAYVFQSKAAALAN